MSTESKAISPESTTTQGISLVQIFFAVVLGASILEFRGNLFPPDFTNLNFWALFTVYFTTFGTWYAWQAFTRRAPYVDSSLSRLRSLIESFCIIVYALLLYAATLVPEHFFAYLWGFAIVYGLYFTNTAVRYSDLHRPEPLRIMLIHGCFQLLVCTAYSIWASVAGPITITAIWVFLFITLGIQVSYRWFLWRFNVKVSQIVTHERKTS